MRRVVIAIVAGIVWAQSLFGADADVVITEILYHPANASDGGEYVELQNTGADAVDLSGWTLSDAVTFTFPQDTVLESGAFLVVAADEARAREFFTIENVVGDYTGKLNNAGETIVLKNAAATDIDVVTYSDGNHPIGADPWPSEPDGAGPSLELLSTDSDNNSVESWGIGQPYSPGAANNPTSPGGGDIVITEIMYQPRKKVLQENLDPRNGGFWWEDGDDRLGEYVEVFNRGAKTIDLSGWSFSDGIEFVFPAGTTLAAGEYLAISKDADAVAAHYEGANVLGNFTGGLENDGERLTLIDANNFVVDTVRYRDTPPWPIGPDGEGQSLELLDPNSGNDRPDNWRANTIPEEEDPDPKRLEWDCRTAPWQTYDITGEATSNKISFFVGGAGEWLIDAVEVVEFGSDQNLLENGSFEVDDSGWSKIGNHSETFHTTEDAFDGMGSEHIVATDGGGEVNSLTIEIPEIVVGQSYTVSFWIRHLSGSAVLSLRMGGGGILSRISARSCRSLGRAQNKASLLVGMATRFVTRGTPGKANTVSSDGIPPLARNLTHFPEVPKSGDSVTISAEVSGSDAIQSVTVDFDALETPYREVTEMGSVPMLDDGLNGDGEAGDGIYTATLDPRESQTLVRYRVTATDAAGRSWTWPDSVEPNPNRAYFVFDNADIDANNRVETFFLILSPDTERALARQPRAKVFRDGTAVFRGVVYDHIGVRWRSDREQPKKSHKLRFNKHEYFLGMSTMDTNYDWPITEKVATDLFFLLGQTNIAMEPVQVVINGRLRGLFALRESPNRSWLRKLGMDADTEIYKSKSSDGCCAGFDPTFPNCPRGRRDFCASNLHWQAHYDSSRLPRMYIKRSDSLGSFQTLRDFIHLLRDAPRDVMEEALDAEVAVWDWLYKSAVHAFQPHCDYHAKNFYVTRTPEGIWDVLFFDYDRFWGCLMFQGLNNPCHSIDTDPKCSGTAFNSRVYQTPALHNRYNLVLKDVAENYFTDEVLSEMIDDWFVESREERRRSQVVTSDGAARNIKRHMSRRRKWILDVYLRRQRLRPLENEHSLITLDSPRENAAGEIKVRWSSSDPEGDPATVDLFWTDFGFAHFVPIPGAEDLPADQGSFVWTEEIPSLGGKRLWIQAVIDDGNGPMVGRSTKPVKFFEGVGPFRRGDCTGDGSLSVTDALSILRYNFGNGPQPDCLAACDVDGDGSVEGGTTDPIYLLRYLFLDGAAPPSPFPDCDVDSAPGSLTLGCETFPAVCDG